MYNHKKMCFTMICSIFFWYLGDIGGYIGHCLGDVRSRAVRCEPENLFNRAFLGCWYRFFVIFICRKIHAHMRIVFFLRPQSSSERTASFRGCFHWKWTEFQICLLGRARSRPSEMGPHQKGLCSGPASCNLFVVTLLQYLFLCSWRTG